MIRILHYLKHYKKECILGPLFKLLEASFELIIPIIMACIIDVGIENKDGNGAFLCLFLTLAKLDKGAGVKTVGNFLTVGKCLQTVVFYRFYGGAG